MVCGQRQVGESITLNHIKEKIDNMLVLLTETLEDQQKRITLYFRNLWLSYLIDEFQKVPSILETIKDIVDKLGNDGKNNNGLFWLAGSQKFKTIKGISDSLAGRVSTGVRRAVAALCKKVQLMKVEKLQKGAIIDWSFLAKRCN